jgi:hypothetical protein
MPGCSPSFVKFRPTFASRLTTRRSQARATQRPAPMACPLIAATLGQGRSRTDKNSL